jgi:hypothetical protein
MKRLRILVILLITAMPVMLPAGEADVQKVDVKKTGGRTFAFIVTVQHDDTGWDHYADKWEVISADGTVVGLRILHHPHVNEQPFTRSLSGVEVPADLSMVTVRAHDSVHGYGGGTATVDLPQ